MVEWKKLGDVCKVLRGKRLTKSQLNESEGYPVLHGGSTPMGYYEEFNRKANTTVVVNTGNAGSVFFYDKEFWSSDACFSLYPNKEINDKFLYLYVYGCERILKGKIRAGAMPTIDAKAVEDLLIPIPSLSEQQRIVSILDTFTSSISNLKQQIEERRKQYEYERDLLLDLEGKEGVEMKTLGEVANFVKDRIEASFLNSQNYVSVENLLKDKAGRIDSENVPFKGNWSCYKHGDVLIGNIRPYLRKIWLADRKGGTNGDVLIIRPNEFILPQFLYCVLASEKFFEYYNQTAKGGKMPRGEKSRALSYIIPLPPLSTQSRIVSILDTFEQSISNLEEQLAMREKQYEYYRNQLLTFEGEEERGKT